MCVEAADGIKVQCGREYGFSDPGEKPRATVLSSLTASELKDLETNNLAAERNLVLFDRRASKASKSRNYKFTAKSVRDDMLLHKGNQNTVDQIVKKISKLLGEREIKWNEIQKKKLEEKVKLKLKQARKVQDNIKKLLNRGKSLRDIRYNIEHINKSFLHQ